MAYKNAEDQKAASKRHYESNKLTYLADKKFAVNFLAATGRIGALKEKIKKCEVVCSNCHRIRTHKRSQSPDNTIMPS